MVKLLPSLGSGLAAKICLSKKLNHVAPVRSSFDGEMKTGPGRKRERETESHGKSCRTYLEEEEEEAVGRAVIAEIRAKRNDADAGKRVRRGNERKGKIFFIWSRDLDCRHETAYSVHI